MSLLVAASLFASTALADDPAPGRQVAASLAIKLKEGDVEKEVTLRYLLFLPAKYQANGERWPLMLFLHGAGERGDDLELVKKWGPPGAVEKNPNFEFVVVSPQCPKEQRWEVAQLIRLVDHLQATLHVDRQRTYVTGLSMGGYGSWALAAAHPDRFAAAVPICGGGDPKKAEKLVDLPIWAFHGDKDTAVPLARSQEMVDAIRAAGGKKVQLTIYPGVGHNSWSATYDNPETFRWLLTHKK